MSQVYLPPNNQLTWLEQLSQQMRMPLIALSLVLILYYTIYLTFFVPLYDIYFSWGRDNVAVVTAVPEDSSAAPYLQAGDKILEADGRPMHWKLWQPQYDPGKDAYEHIIERDGELLTLLIPVSEPTLKLIRERVTIGTISLVAWLIGMLIILFAIPQNHDAWVLGLTILGGAVVLAASEASLYGVPGAWLNTYPFLPLVSIGLIKMALLPRDESPSRRERIVFRTLCAGGVISGIVAIFEILYLNPHSSSLLALIGISLYDLLYLWVGVGALAYLIILTWRYVQISDSYLKQQLLILLTFTGIALLPAVLLTILPRLLFDAPLLHWVISILLLTLIPAGYGYVIYRKNYLGLDIFVTNSLTYLLISLMLFAAYALIYYFVQNQDALAALEPLSGSFLLLPVLMFTPFAGRQIQKRVENVIYGAPSSAQKNRLQAITSTLAADPQMETLKQTVRKVATILQVRQMVLLLENRQGKMVCVEQLRVSKNIEPLPINEQSSLFGDILVRHQKGVYHPLFDQFDWVDYIVPLGISERMIGVWLLGRPVPDGYLHSKQIGFLRQAADIVAVATEAMRLFESSREMSRKLLRIRDEERRQLASQIHDQPLQDISMVTNELERLASCASSNNADRLNEPLNDQKQTLQSTADQLRSICIGLYPAELKQGPQLAVRETVYVTREKTGLDIALTIDVSYELVIPRQTTVSIYYILKEALNNVYKHADATAVWVHFGYQDGQLVLSVADNGRYQSIASLPISTLIRDHHFGVAGMHEWASLVNGHLAIAERESGGTAVTLTIPFPSA